jgi:FAD/FMN-containing dehydrogenase
VIESPDTYPPIRGLVRADARARAAYAEAAGIHRLVPSLVARPLDAADIQALVRWARATGTALTPRGAGSSMGGGAVGTGCVVDLRELDRPWLRVDPGTRTAIAAAPVTLGAIDAAARPHGLRVAVDPSSAGWATIGGTLMTNAAGARTVRSGPMRNWVRAVTFVDGHGERHTWRRDEAIGTGRYAELMTRLTTARAAVREAFPRTRKNTCGYALDQALRTGHPLDLLIGSEGTLGLVTEVELLLEPLPSARASLRLDLPSLDLLPDAVALIGAHEPSACELLDRSFLDVARAAMSPALAAALAHVEAVLLVDLESWTADDDLDGRRRHLRHALEPAGVTVVEARTEAEAHDLWALRHAASPILAGLGEHRRSLQVIEDGCVPVERLADYLRLVRASCAAERVACVCFGHAGDGHVHVNLLPDLAEHDWLTRVQRIYAAVSDGLLALGGTPSGEHGDGRLRAGLAAQRYGPEMQALFADVKRAFDPDGILAPGVKLGRGDDPFDAATLKVGDARAPLPDDIEAGLRLIERERGWATDRLRLADGGTTDGAP